MISACKYIIKLNYFIQQHISTIFIIHFLLFQCIGFANRVSMRIPSLLLLRLIYNNNDHMLNCLICELLNIKYSTDVKYNSDIRLCSLAINPDFSAAGKSGLEMVSVE